MTDENEKKIKEIRKRINSPWRLKGKWSVMEKRHQLQVVDKEDQICQLFALLNPERAEANADFIANAPDDITYLLSLLAEKDAEIARLKSGAMMMVNPIYNTRNPLSCTNCVCSFDKDNGNVECAANHYREVTRSYLANVRDDNCPAERAVAVAKDSK